MLDNSLPRYHVTAVTDGTYWIMDRLWPGKDINDPELLCTKSRLSADTVCKILNDHNDRSKAKPPVYGELAVVK